MAPEIALQNAIVAALVADPAVNALVKGKVYDEVPSDRQGAVPPYLELGPVGSQRDELSGGPGWAVTLRLYAYSTGYGRRGAWDIARAAATVLEGANLELEAPHRALLPVEVIRTGDVIDPPNPKSVFLDVTTTVGSLN